MALPESTKQMLMAHRMRQPDVGSIEPLTPMQVYELEKSKLSSDPVIANLQKLGRGVKGLLEPVAPLDYFTMVMPAAKVAKPVLSLLPPPKPVDTSYRIAHQARGREFDDAIQLDDLTKDISGNQAGYPDNFYTPKGQKIYAQGPQFKGDEYGQANLESYNAILKAKNKPDDEITIYRAVPKGVKDINEGDFVTLSPKYAELHAESGYGLKGDESGEVISQTVKVKDLIWDANDVNEFGYFPTGK